MTSDRLIRVTLVVALALLIVACSTDDAGAQLFGARTLGQPLTRSTRAQSDAGQVQSSDRFLRNNRSARDFVGQDMGDQGGFVGSLQAITSGTVRSAAESLRPAEESDVNRNAQQVRPGRQQPYAPRLMIAFDHPALSQPADKTVIEKRLQPLLWPGRGSTLQVEVQQRTAILKGEVATESDRLLAEQLVLLEPGISQVRNQLQVRETLPELAP
jgi:hypothetical protein